MTTRPSAEVDVADSRWGRRPGARPPLPVWGPAAFASALGLLLVLVVVVVVKPAGPLDETTLADQRNGLLRGGPVVATDTAGVSFGDDVVALLFVRDQPAPDVLTGWAAQLPDGVRTVVVVQADDGVSPVTGAVEVVADPGQELARAVELPTPNDGGPGVGYAVVDGERVVQYATLDPMWPQNAFEVATIAGAVS